MGLFEFAGDILGGIFGWKGAEMQANATREAGERAAQVQRETNAMTVDLANTAHQREVSDMRLAGLNPLLSATGGRGAETPTLRAPTQAAEGEGEAGRIMGNAMSVLPMQILQFMKGQQEIEYTRAQTDKTNAETEKTKTETNWLDPLNAQSLSESGSRVVQNTANTIEAQARTATIDAMRNPQVKNIVAEAALKAQQTKTEEQRTIEQQEAAKNANKLFGARANEAATLAAQAASYYKNFFMGQEQNKLNEKDLQIQLLRDQDFALVLDNILKNDYGRQISWSKIFSTLTSTGAAAGGPKGKVKP